MMQVARKHILRIRKFRAHPWDAAVGPRRRALSTGKLPRVLALLHARGNDYLERHTINRPTVPGCAKPSFGVLRCMLPTSIDLRVSLVAVEPCLECCSVAGYCRLAGADCHRLPRLPPCCSPIGILLLCSSSNPQVKSHLYVKLASSIVDALPPEEIPRVRIPTPTLSVSYSNSAHGSLHADSSISTTNLV